METILGQSTAGDGASPKYGSVAPGGEDRQIVAKFNMDHATESNDAIECVFLRGRPSATTRREHQRMHRARGSALGGQDRPTASPWRQRARRGALEYDPRHDQAHRPRDPV